MDLNIFGKNALVCGSSRGIGKAAAIELSKLGANVTLVSRSTEKMSEVIREMQHENGQDHDFLVADFSEPLDLRKKVKALVAGKTIHILVNNTGGPPPGEILEADENAFKEAFTKHLICNHLLAQLVSKGMIRSGYGRIINIISTSVKTPLSSLGVSNTIRAAVANWAKTLANELGRHNITVNNVLPGSTDTDRLKEIIKTKAKIGETSIEKIKNEQLSGIPLGRFGTVEEIAAVIAFVASPAASYITGTNITVDGGRTASL